jgi:F0F1-type ATP synthase membrane subunit c/vacuolar-type H+-ATPase subunit K
MELDTNDQSDYPVEGSPAQYSSGPPELPPSTTPEPLNPWLTIVYRPRDTIRYVLDTGVWNNIWLLYAIVMIGTFPSVVLSAFSQPVPEGFPVEAYYIGYSVGYFVLGYPLAMLMLYFAGWLIKVVGSWFEGRATSRETRIALAWTNIVNLYLGLMMLAPNALLIYSNRPWDSEDPELLLLYSLMAFALATPALIIQIIFASKCIAEAHRFSAWKGLFTLLIVGAGLFSALFFFFFILFIFIFILAMAASV